METAVKNKPRECDFSQDMHVTVKTLVDSEDFTVERDCTVRQLKQRVAERVGTGTERMLLIHSGRALGESELLSHHQGQDGSVLLCMVLRRQQSTVPSRSGHASETLQPAQTALICDPAPDNLTPSPTSPLCLVEGMGSLDLTSSGRAGFFTALQRQMEGQLLADPALMCRVLSSPLVQGSLSEASPQLTRQLILSNPQALQLLHADPEVADMLNQPEVFTQMLELSKNPEMLQEVISNQNRALGNVQPRQSNTRDTISGDFNVLERTDMKAQEQCLNTSSKIWETSSSGNSQPIRTESEKALPIFSYTTEPPMDLNATPLSDPAPQNPVTEGMQSLLEHVTLCPDLMENLLSGPHVGRLLACLSQTPGLAAQMLMGHPLCSGNPEFQQIMRQQMPLFLQQIQDPDILSAMLNPRAMEALLQIQQGLQTLASEAPALIPATELGSFGTGLNSTPDSTLNNQSVNDPQVATVTEQQKRFVQQMLQTLASHQSEEAEFP